MAIKAPCGRRYVWGGDSKVGVEMESHARVLARVPHHNGVGPLLSIFFIFFSFFLGIFVASTILSTIDIKNSRLNYGQTLCIYSSIVLWVSSDICIKTIGDLETNTPLTTTNTCLYWIFTKISFPFGQLQ